MGKDLPNADPTIFAPYGESHVQTALNAANGLGADVQTAFAAKHVAWTVSSTAYLRNLDEEDLAGECIAVHHASSPHSFITPVMIIANHFGQPRGIADRVAAILNAHWDSFDQPAAPAEEGGNHG